jgi:phage shock protein PspC (stress-responsive transcriptional regulator)
MGSGLDRGLHGWRAKGGFATMADMTTEQPGTVSQPSGTTTEPRRLRRRTTERVIAGVAGGVADYLNVDPLLLRVSFAGLMIFGGAGLVLYVLAWLLIPPRGRDDSIVQEWFGRLVRRFGTVPIAVLALLAAVIGGAWLVEQAQPCMVSLDGPFTGECMNNGFGWLFGYEPVRLRDAALLAVAVIVIGFVVLRWREGRGSAAAAGPSTATIGPDPAMTSVTPVAAWTPPSIPVEAVPAIPRPRSPLGWYVLAAALIAVGLLAVVDISPGLRVGLGQYFGAALGVLGLGLIVGAWWGRARLLILFGIVLLPLAFTAAHITVPLDGGYGEQMYRPQTVGELRPEYRLAGGEIYLDLTSIHATRPVAISVSVGVGRLVVLVPKNARLELDARVSGGRLSLLGGRQTGTRLADRVERPSGAGPHLVLDLETGVGEVLVLMPGEGG